MISLLQHLVRMPPSTFIPSSHTSILIFSHLNLFHCQFRQESLYNDWSPLLEPKWFQSLGSWSRSANSEVHLEFYLNAFSSWVQRVRVLLVNQESICPFMSGLSCSSWSGLLTLKKEKHDLPLQVTESHHIEKGRRTAVWKSKGVTSASHQGQFWLQGLFGTLVACLI